VRLKGGCPSTFSRVGSELRALSAASIPHEMVPGVSSALAAPVLAGEGCHKSSFCLSCLPYCCLYLVAVDSTAVVLLASYMTAASTCGVIVMTGSWVVGCRQACMHIRYGCTVRALTSSNRASNHCLWHPNHFSITAGFPLTDAVLSTSYTVLTAHAPDKMEWSKYAQLDTIVLLMAASNLRVIMQHLLDTAWPPETPVSICPALQSAQSFRLGRAVWSCCLPIKAYS